MRTHAQPVFYAAILSTVLFCFSCAHGVRLHVQGVNTTVAPGTYATILYGCNYTDDPESVAFLDKEGDPYAMEPYAPDFKYRVIRGMNAKEAFAVAEGFLRCSTSLQGYKMREIMAPVGETIGYEIRPVYYPFVYGADNMLSVDYWLKDDRVLIQIRLEPWAEHLFFGGSSVIEN